MNQHRATCNSAIFFAENTRSVSFQYLQLPRYLNPSLDGVGLYVAVENLKTQRLEHIESRVLGQRRGYQKHDRDQMYEQYLRDLHLLAHGTALVAVDQNQSGRQPIHSKLA